jgi:hypothetical protein
VELALLLAPLPEGEDLLDPPGEPGDDGLHLGDLVGRQREEPLVGEEVPPPAVGLPLPPGRQLPLDVLPFSLPAFRLRVRSSTPPGGTRLQGRRLLGGLRRQPDPNAPRSCDN